VKNTFINNGELGSGLAEKEWLNCVFQRNH